MKWLQTAKGTYLNTDHVVSIKAEGNTVVAMVSGDVFPKLIEDCQTPEAAALKVKEIVYRLTDNPTTWTTI